MKEIARLVVNCLLLMLAWTPIGFVLCVVNTPPWLVMVLGGVWGWHWNKIISFANRRSI